MIIKLKKNKTKQVQCIHKRSQGVGEGKCSPLRHQNFFWKSCMEEKNGCKIKVVKSVRYVLTIAWKSDEKRSSIFLVKNACTPIRKSWLCLWVHHVSLYTLKQPSTNKKQRRKTRVQVRTQVHFLENLDLTWTLEVQVKDLEDSRRGFACRINIELTFHYLLIFTGNAVKFI
jgi:hypothetical protein